MENVKNKKETYTAARRFSTSSTVSCLLAGPREDTISSVRLEVPISAALGVLMEVDDATPVDDAEPTKRVEGEVGRLLLLPSGVEGDRGSAVRRGPLLRASGDRVRPASDDEEEEEEKDAGDCDGSNDDDDDADENED